MASSEYGPRLADASRADRSSLTPISPMIRGIDGPVQQQSLESLSLDGADAQQRRIRSEGHTPLTPLPPTPSMGPINAEITQEQVESVRNGQVLSRTMALKEDHFPLHAGASMPIRMTGAPNFRMAEVAHVYGVGQPTVAGIRAVLNFLGAARRQGQRPVLWVNLREEPVVYLSQRPFVLRNVEQVFKNITEYAGISCDRIETLEWRLKEDIIREADSCRGNVAVLDETRTHHAAHAWEPIVDDEVLTPREVARLLRMQGYNMTYYRVPMTPERPPEASQLDAVYRIVNAAHPSTAIVFNCQTGRARTTTAMIAACIVRWANGLLPPLPRAPAQGDAASASEKRRPDTDEAETTEAQYWLASLRRGEYRAVRQLMQWLPSDGARLKDVVDRVAAVCGHALHVVHVIARYRARAEAAGGADEGASFLRRAAVALERYLHLILFAKYAADRRVARRDDPAGARRRQNFSEWMRDHADLASIAVDLSGDKAVTALGARRAQAAAPPLTSRGADMGATRLSLSLGKQDAAFIASRRGSVLCANAILERDQASRAHAAAAAGLTAGGRPREFPSSGLSRVHAIGTPNAEGVRAVLHRIQSLSGMEPPPPLGLALGQSIADADAPGPGPGSALPLGHAADAPFTPVRHSMSLQLRRGASGGRAQSLGGSGLYATPGDSRARCVTLWLNLRDTPFVYVNGRPLTVRDAATLFRGASLGAHATPERLEGIEERLKDDVLAELRRGQGRLLVHEMSHDGALSGSWEHVPHHAVLTPREFFLRETEMLGNVVYARIPVPRGSDFSPGVVQSLLRHLDRSRLHVVCSSAAQGGRSAMAMLVTALWLRQRDGNVAVRDLLLGQVSRSNSGTGRPHTPTTPRGENGDALAAEMDEEADFSPVLALQRLLEGCVAARRRVDDVADSVGHALHLRRELVALAKQVAQERTKASMASALARAAIMLRRYMHLIIFQVYLNARGETAGKADSPTFEEWVASRRELATLFKEVGADPAAALRQVGGPSDSEHRVRKRVTSRKGRVLGRGAIIKFDHFPGCQRKTLEQAVSGAPNFRSVVIDGVALHVHGTAVPTKEGVVDVVRYLRALDAPSSEGDVGEDATSEADAEEEDGEASTPASPADTRALLPNPTAARPPPAAAATAAVADAPPPTVSDGAPFPTERGGAAPLSEGSPFVLWVNLREEPIVYVNGRPFVLRELRAPTYNVAHSGIATEHVERMEEGLKEDLEREAEEAGGRALLHDENENYEVMGHDEPVGRGSVETPLEVYRSLQERGFALEYERVPITDEQAPKWEDVDRIARAVLRVPLRGHVVINCQMGRGRTTTGMVIAAMVRLWMTRQWALLQGLSRSNPTPAAAEPDAEDNESDLLAGNFRSIRSLVRVLHGGAVAKARLDAVVDACAAMQNLREAMLRLKRGSQDAGVTTQDRLHSAELGIHYLRRYFVLICFSGFLMAHEPTSGLGSFADWMKHHGELQTLLSAISFE